MAQPLPFVFINSSSPLSENRQDLEDDLEVRFADVFEVTGGGSGAGGWNIDLDVLQPNSIQFAVADLCSYLRDRAVPRDTWLNANRARVNVYS